MFASLRRNAQLGGACDIKNHILNHSKHATTRALKNRSIGPMGEREKSNEKKGRKREVDRL